MKKSIESLFSTGENAAEAGFELHQQLAADTVVVGDLPLCTVLLSRDANYPWLILVPRRANVSEVFELSDNDQIQFLLEQVAVSKLVQQVYLADKINVAALGNVVPQLHLHIVARFTKDAAWPKPIWGKVAALKYTSEQLESRIDELQQALAKADVEFTF